MSFDLFSRLLDLPFALLKLFPPSILSRLLFRRIVQPFKPSGCLIYEL